MNKPRSLIRVVALLSTCTFASGCVRRHELLTAVAEWTQLLHVIALTLQELCITAAERYYQFLEENNLGLIELVVLKKESSGKDLWRLVLARRIFDVDTIQLKVRGQSIKRRKTATSP